MVEAALKKLEKLPPEQSIEVMLTMGECMLSVMTEPQLRNFRAKAAGLFEDDEHGFMLLIDGHLALRELRKA